MVRIDVADHGEIDAQRFLLASEVIEARLQRFWHNGFREIVGGDLSAIKQAATEASLASSRDDLDAISSRLVSLFREDLDESVSNLASISMLLEIAGRKILDVEWKRAAVVTLGNRKYTVHLTNRTPTMKRALNVLQQERAKRGRRFEVNFRDEASSFLEIPLE